MACTLLPMHSARSWTFAAAAEWRTRPGAELFLDSVHYGPHGADRRSGIGLRLPGLLGLQDLRAAHGVPVGPP